ncbi:MAG: peptidoglycan bridge formation glycyltransferase FemA/FemB family protein [bacterium]
MLQQFLQTQAWAKVRETQGQRPVWLGNTLMLIKKLPYPLHNIGLINQADFSNCDWDLLQKTAQKEKLSHVYLEPANLKKDFQFSADIIKKYQLQPAKPVVLRHTVVMDLKKSEAILQEEMEKKSRYNANYALKKGVQYTFSQDDQDFEIFLKLFFTAKAQKYFFARSPQYYRTVWNILKQNNNCMIVVARYENEPLLAKFIFLFDKTIIFPYSGYSRNHLNLKATYGVNLEIIRWGQAHGYETIDMWGAKPEVSPDDQEYGFTKFKLSFAPQGLIEYADCYDMVISPFYYKLFKFSDKLRWILLKLKKRIA